jgi:hypothetical protein
MELQRHLPSLLTMKNPRIARTATVLAALSLTAAACGGDGAAIEIDGAWARTSPMSAEAGAAYFQISSETDDVLIGASVDASVAGTVEIHETRMVEGSEDSSMDDDSPDDDSMDDDSMEVSDVMEMVEVGRIELPAGETVSLEPGGFHIMMLDLAAPLADGDTFELTLDFETADDQVVTVTVGDSAP